MSRVMPEREPGRLVYRFMSKSELIAWQARTLQFRGKPDLIAAAEKDLVAEMARLLAHEDFVEMMKDFTMTPYGGGPAGTSGQAFVAATSDVEALVKSTDPAVQRIVKNADCLATLHLPKMGCIDAASELSQSEREVLIPNLPRQLGATLVDYRDNPYRRA